MDKGLINRLAQELDLSPAAVERSLRNLIERGLVAERRDDRRRCECLALGISVDRCAICQ
jgi:predicted transcriptional regulator